MSCLIIAVLAVAVAACNRGCGQTCLEQGVDVSECLWNCGCAVEAQTALHWNEVRVSNCQSECAAVCTTDACTVQCMREFCSAPLHWTLSLLVCVLLVSVFYFAYLLVPKTSKRGRYWRNRVTETHYQRLEDY